MELQNNAFIFRHKCVNAESRRDCGSSNFLFEESREIDVRPFLLDGWLKLGLRLSFMRDDKSVQCKDRTNSSPGGIRVLKDQDIRKNVALNASTDVFGIPTRYIFRFFPTTSPKDVKNKVCS